MFLQNAVNFTLLMDINGVEDRNPEIALKKNNL